jgi:mono/diheme cytochrome c family protein
MLSTPTFAYGSGVIRNWKAINMRILFLSAAVVALVSGGCADGNDAASQGGEVAQGEQAYAENCRRCHGPSRRLRSRIPGQTTDDQADWLDSFLAGHYARDDKVRADLIAFLTR